MRWSQGDVREGMIVTTSVGDRLGKVISCGAETFVVEKGRFSPKDYELRYDHILNVDDGGITYSLTDLESGFGASAAPSTEAGWRADAGSRTEAGSRAETQPRRAAAAATAAAATTARETNGSAAARASESLSAAARDETSGRQEARIPLMEEEIGIEKIARESGHVRIHKTVKVEQKHITVPVTREDVVIERVAAATNGEPLHASEATFQEQTLDVPLHEEEVKVSKRPRLREEVVVRTVIQAVQRDASADLRHEEAEIEDTRSGRLANRSAEETSPSRTGYGAPGRR